MSPSSVLAVKKIWPAYEEAEITKVGAYHRFYSGDKDAITGENIVAEKELDRTNNIDSEHGVATAVFTIPAAGGKFTEAERAKVSLSNLVVYVNVSYRRPRHPIGRFTQIRCSCRLDPGA